MVILGFVAMKEYTLRNGIEITLKTVPVDPRDLFRGDYVVLHYEISTIDLNSYPIDQEYLYHDMDYVVTGNRVNKITSVKEGDEIKVVLDSVGQNVYHVSKVYKKLSPKKNEIYLKGKVTKLNDYNNTIEVNYGIESYFVPEGKGREIERARGGDTLVKVVVDQSGRSVIKSVSVGDKTYNY